MKENIKVFISLTKNDIWIQLKVLIWKHLLIIKYYFFPIYFY